MGIALARRAGYSRAEYLSDTAVHLTGVLAVTAAVPVLIVLAALLDGSVGRVTAVTVYGASLFAMIACSAVYNIFPHPEWEWLLQRLKRFAFNLRHIQQL